MEAFKKPNPLIEYGAFIYAIEHANAVFKPAAKHGGVFSSCSKATIEGSSLKCVKCGKNVQEEEDNSTHGSINGSSKRTKLTANRWKY